MNPYVILDKIEVMGMVIERCLPKDDPNGKCFLRLSRTVDNYTVRIESGEWSDLDAVRMVGFLLKSRMDKKTKYNPRYNGKPKLKAVLVSDKKNDPVNTTDLGGNIQSLKDSLKEQIEEEIIDKMQDKLPISTPIRTESGKKWELFKIKDDNFGQVALVGSFNQWDTKNPVLLKKHGNFWFTYLSLDEGTYEYKFIVDGAWRLDPSHPHIAANDEGASANSVREVRNASMPKNVGRNAEFYQKAHRWESEGDGA